MFVVLSFYSNTGLETSSPFVNCVIDNGLPQARPHFHQALLQFIRIFYRLLVHTLLYAAQNAVVNRVEVGAVGRPEVRQDERWCLTTQKLNRRTCPMCECIILLSWYPVL